MTVRPSSRLDVLLVPERSDPPEPLVDTLVAAGWLGAGGVPGPKAAGNFEAWRLDRPGVRTLYANRQGGFTVRCPTTDAVVIDGFTRAWGAARGTDGPMPALQCPGCGLDHELSALTFRPAAAFGAWALELARASTSIFALPPLPFPVQTVLRRG